MARELKPCGTHAAYMRHLHHGETPCEECKAAHRLYCEEGRVRRVAKGLAPDDPRHGKASTYSNWVCRCDACKEAMRLINAYTYEQYRKGLRGGKMYQ